MLKDKGDVNASIDMYKEFIKQNKNNRDLYLSISECLLEIREEKEAESYLKKAIKLFPEDNFCLMFFISSSRSAIFEFPTVVFIVFSN